MPRQPLPADYQLTIVELGGRFYPVTTSRDRGTGLICLDSSPHLYWSVENLFGIPFALGAQPTTGYVSFRTYAQALAFCHRQHESFSLRLAWEKLTTQSEVYPERNVWYREEIGRRTTNPIWCNRDGWDVYCSVFLHDGTYCSVRALTIDEALEALYQKVEAASRKEPACLLS